MRASKKIQFTTIIAAALFVCCSCRETGSRISKHSGDGERNLEMEKRLRGIWGDKPNVSQFTFLPGNHFEEITPVPEMKGTYKVFGNMIHIKAIKTMYDQADEKYNVIYVIEKFVDKKTLKLKSLPYEGITLEHNLRYGEKAE